MRNTSHCLLCNERLSPRHTPDTTNHSAARSQRPPENRSECIPEAIARFTQLCWACHHHLPWHHLSNTQHPNTTTFNVSKPDKPFKRNQVVCAFHYRFPIDHMIQELKFHKQLHHLELLSHYLAEQIYFAEHNAPQHSIDGIIPIPLHPQRLRQRGYNQSYWLAKSLGKRLNLPVWDHCCIRTKNTQAQSTLSAKKRAENLHAAFQIRREKLPTAQHVAILDDVLTTGATMEALTQTLHSAGIKRISIWTLAKADRETV
ncbi:MAG: ComF family protein [Gammaproteobacteria bacterium]